MTDAGWFIPEPTRAAPPRPPRIVDDRLVQAKLSRPEVPAGYVDRPRLRTALDVATKSPVTLVTGGPGWGKTLLVASWAAGVDAKRTSAWLTLDVDDDEPRVFWAYVLAALRGSGAVPPDSPLASLDPRNGLSAAIYRRIQVGLSQLRHEVVLVLDDVSDVRSRGVHEQIARLFRYESPLRTVLVSRAEPPLILGRPRVAGALAEIGTGDLAFTAVEAGQLLAVHGISVHPADVARLLDRTEGWATGLRLAAMFLRRPGAQPADFGGSDRAVADYLLGEVVAGHSARTWRFLLETSLVSSVCGDLADALTGHGQGQRTLDRLERENAFVTALGPDRRWYRYHALLGEALRRQLEIEQADTLPPLHERAARWFAENGRPLDAVRHAVAAGNWPLAGRLATHGALHRLQTTDRRALAAALAQIPPAELSRTAELQLCAAGRRMVEGRYADIAPHLAAARALLDQDGDAADPSTRVELSLFEGVVARIRGSATGVHSAASSALKILDQHGAAVPLAPECRAIALNTSGVGLLWLGETEPATAALEAGLEASVAAGVELTQVNALGHLGLVAALSGRLREAGHWAGRCRALAEARGWADLLQAATGYLSLALVSTARGDLDEAERLLSLGLRTQRGVPEPLALSALRLAQAGVDVARGRYDDARMQLDRVRGAVNPTEGPTVIDRWLARTGAEVDLAAGAVAAVRARLEAVRAVDRSDVETLLLARARLAEGEEHGLARLLDPVVQQRRDLHLAVQASILQALAADRLRMDNEALQALGRALVDAEPEHLLSPFTSLQTARLRNLLERTVVLEAPRGGVGYARVVLGILGAAPSASMADLSMEVLTEREQVILRYLATMRSNAEIAHLLYISPNTVKVHLRNVYRKLGVVSRRAAVLRARELGVLDDVTDVADDLAESDDPLRPTPGG